MPMPASSYDRSIQHQIDRLKVERANANLTYDALTYMIAAVRSGGARNDAYGDTVRGWMRQMMVSRAEMMETTTDLQKQIDALQDELVRRTLKRVGR